MEGFALFIRKVLKTNTISIPIANHDNNQHAENETFDFKICLTV
jgi:hypothetical protein